MGKDTIATAADGSVEQALKDTASSAADQRSLWLVLGYEDKNTLKVIAQGEGDASSVTPYFEANECRFALVRCAYKVELANTVKMAYICWSPDSIPPMRKALLSIHKPQVQALMQPFHVFHEAKEQSDIENLVEVLDDKLGFSSGKKLHVATKEGYAAVGGGIVAGPNKSPGARSSPTNTFAGGKKEDLLPKVSTKSAVLGFDDEDAVRNAIKAVRDDANENDWCLIGYAPGNKVNILTLNSQGTGGADALAAALDTNNVWYGYFRQTEVIDRSTTVKFGMLTLMTQSISPIKRAKIATHRGFITELFAPFHVEFAINEPSEFNKDIVTAKIGASSGQANFVSDKPESQLASKMYTSKKAEFLVAEPEKNKEKINWEDLDGLKAAIAAVRDDSNDTDFCLTTWSAKNNTMSLVAQGNGGFEAIKSNSKSGQVEFALLRTTDQVDKTVAVKFVFLRVVPGNLPATAKAKIATKAGVIDPVFSPYHVDFVVESFDELSQEIIADKVAAMAGTKQWSKA
jgi:hypothetical protein